MSLARAVLVGFALLYGGFGVAFLLRPVQAGSLVEFGLDSPTARAEVRAMYGGLELGLAAFLLACARRREWMAPGLLACVLSIGAMAAGRLVGILLEEPPGRVMYVALAAETSATAVALWTLARLGRGEAAG